MSHFTTQDIARALQVVLTTDSDVQAVLGEQPRLYAVSYTHLTLPTKA